MIIEKNENADPSTVVVYEIVPRFLDGWKSAHSNLLTKESFLVEDPAAEEAVSLEEDTMDVAETHLFRPLFRYRAVQERNKKRINQYKDFDY